MVDWLMLATVLVALAIVALSGMACYFLYRIIKSDDSITICEKLDGLNARIDLIAQQVDSLEDRVEALIEDCEYVG